MSPARSLEERQLTERVFGTKVIPSLGRILWLDAAAISLSDTDPVATWPDLSGLGNDATQVTSGNRPTFRTNVVNGLPVVRFAGASSQFLDLPNLYSGATEGEIFLALSAADPPASAAQAGSWVFGSSANADHYPYIDGVVYVGWGSNARKTCGNPTPSLATFHVLNISSATNAWGIRINGTTLFSTASNTVGFSTTPKLGRNVGGHFMVGDMGSVIAYDRVLSSTERTEVLDYLTGKYAL